MDNQNLISFLSTCSQIWATVMVFLVVLLRENAKNIVLKSTQSQNGQQILIIRAFDWIGRTFFQAVNFFVGIVSGLIEGFMNGRSHAFSAYVFGMAGILYNLIEIACVIKNDQPLFYPFLVNLILGVVFFSQSVSAVKQN